MIIERMDKNEIQEEAKYRMRVKWARLREQQQNDAIQPIVGESLEHPTKGNIENS